MRKAIEEQIRADIAAGKDERSVRSFVQSKRLQPDDERQFLDLIDDEIAIHELKTVRKQDGLLLVYLGYILMALAIFFGLYYKYFGVVIFLLGIVILRRGKTKIRETESIESIADLLPDEPTKFHKRRF